MAYSSKTQSFMKNGSQQKCLDKALSPLLPTDIDYEVWKKEIKIWRLFTSTDKKKQAPAIFFSLAGQAREAIVGFAINKLSCYQGFENLIEELDKLYLKDSQYSAYEAYEQFKKFCRTKSMSIGNYIIKFERLYNKIKNFNIALPDGVLAYKFLNKANISEQHKQLVHATLTELKYENMKDQNKKLFSDLINFSDIVQDEQSIKVEPTYHQDVFHSSSNRFCLSKRGSFSPRYRNDRFFDRTNDGRKFSKNSDRSNESQGFGRRTNPLDKNGEISKCNVCGSIHHCTQQCPDSYENRTKLRDESQITLCMDTL